MRRPNFNELSTRYRGEDGFGEFMYYERDVKKLMEYIEFLEACREYDASGENRPNGYIVTKYHTGQRQKELVIFDIKQNTMETGKRLKQAISKKSKKGIAKSLKQNTMEKRKIESAAELVNAMELGVGVLNIYDELVTLQSIFVFYARYKEASLGDDIIDGVFRYAEPVEVVELWGISILNEPIFREEKPKKPTHKQTQIIQNNRVIWTKTEEL